MKGHVHIPACGRIHIPAGVPLHRFRAQLAMVGQKKCEEEETYAADCAEKVTTILLRRSGNYKFAAGKTLARWP